MNNKICEEIQHFLLNAKKKKAQKRFADFLENSVQGFLDLHLDECKFCNDLFKSISAHQLDKIVIAFAIVNGILESRKRLVDEIYKVEPNRKETR